VLLLAFYCLLLTPLGIGAPTDKANPKSLFDGRRWFELRDSVAGSVVPEFYEGLVACAFNDTRRCEKKLGGIIKSRPKSDEAIEAHRRLASLYMIHGRYREAAAQVDAVSTIKPNDSDALSVRPLLAALSEFTDQQTVRRQSTTLELEEGGVPFSINGVQGTYWFDTGANFSILSESEAKRFGLDVRAVAAKARVTTGEQVDFRIAVADQISFGPILLRNVAFLVFPDDQPPFKDQPVGFTRAHWHTGAPGVREVCVGEQEVRDRLKAGKCASNSIKSLFRRKHSGRATSIRRAEPQFRAGYRGNQH
jgi:hypothetical protein